MTEIEHRHLRSALEFAVMIAAEGQKRRPPLAFPRELKPLLSRPRLPGSALGRVRRAVEGDPSFRAAISAGALPELVDEVGRLWLAGSPGWEAAAMELVEQRSTEHEESELRRDLKRAEKRRLAAEQATARVQVELLHRDALVAEQAAELDGLRADLVKAVDELDEVRAELVDTRNEIRHARDREAAAVARAEAIAASQGSDGTREGVASGAGNGPVRSTGAPGADDDADDARRRLRAAVDASREFVEHLESLLADDDVSEPGVVRRGAGRAPLPLPGGLISTSAAAARHLVAAGAPLFVDGYNVAKLAWPGRTLEQQRDALISRVENLARRHGAEITVVFDGSSVVGAHAGRRSSVRVVYSPEGTTADDVIRAEVAHVAADTGVVVVTNDREIVDDVKALGANVIPSNAFIAVL